MRKHGNSFVFIPAKQLLKIATNDFKQIAVRWYCDTFKDIKERVEVRQTKENVLLHGVISQAILMICFE